MYKYLIINCLIIVFTLPLPNIHAHKQNVHQYIVVEAYKLLKNNLGYDITQMQTRVGDLSSWYVGDMPWQRGYLTTGAWREDSEDPVYGYSDSWPPGVSGTHFWVADNGDEVPVTLKFVASGIASQVTIPNAYQKILKYIDPNQFWEIKYTLTPGSCTFNLWNGGTVSIMQYGGVGFKYNSLIELYKTGHGYLTGYYMNINGEWTTCNYEIRLGQGWLDVIVWEILGRMCHLLQDMSIPAHAHGDAHGLCEGWPITGVAHDTYENWVGSDEYPYSSPYLYWNSTNVNAFINPYAIGTVNPIHYLMYTTQQISDHFSSNGPYDGDGNNILTHSQGPYSHLNVVLASLPGPQSITDFSCCSDLIPQYACLNREGTSLNNRENIRDITLPQSIRATAGLLYWFAVETGLIAKKNSKK